jgi:NitT/TauT family transport system ATP-binding protein
VDSGAVRTKRLEIADLAYAYEGRTPTLALDGVTLDVEDNEFLAIVGPVGCGKTTFLRLVSGFLRPARGTVRCDGKAVSGPSPERGYVFQEEAIFPWMTVRENLEFGLLAAGLEPASREPIVADLVGLIGLRGYEEAYPKELSAGMSKMVEVARVLATDPSLLLLDEPFGPLDAQTRGRMQEALSAVWAQRKRTVVLVTHDVDEAIWLADRIVVFSPRPGRVKAQVEVALPRPRPVEVRLSPAFTAIKRIVWQELGLVGGAAA